MGAKIAYPKGWSGGISIRGIPIVNTAPANVFYVSSVTGASTNSGKTQSKPLATVAQAVAKCTASRGDIVFCLPGHVETFATAAALTLNKIGVQVIGLGIGTIRPTFTFSDTASQVVMSAANVGIHNCIHTCAVDSLVNGFALTAAGISFTGNTFNYTSTNDSLMWILTDSGSDDFVFQNNYCLGDHAGPTEFMRLIGVDRAIITDNFISGSYSTAVINGITTASTNLLIDNNTLMNSVTNKLWIDLVASCTGRIQNNVGTVVSTAGITDANIIDAANCQLSGNYASDAAGETGRLIGVVSA